MDERRLRVTVDESRHLFQNLLGEARRSYGEVFPEAEDDEASDANWQAVDREVRAVYEMARFALEVVDKPGTDDIDEFRGFCEDVDGLEPLDRPLLNTVGRLCVQINDQLLANAEYRRKIPRVVGKSFDSYVEKKRRFFDDLAAADPAAAVANAESGPDGKLVDVAGSNEPPSKFNSVNRGTESMPQPEFALADVPPEMLESVTTALCARLQTVSELLESV